MNTGKAWRKRGKDIPRFCCGSLTHVPQGFAVSGKFLPVPYINHWNDAPLKPPIKKNLSIKYFTFFSPGVTEIGRKGWGGMNLCHLVVHGNVDRKTNQGGMAWQGAPKPKVSQGYCVPLPFPFVSRFLFHLLLGLPVSLQAPALLTFMWEESYHLRHTEATDL